MSNFINSTFIHSNLPNFNNVKDINISSPKINKDVLATLFNKNEIEKIVINSGKLIKINNEEIKRLDEPLENYGASKSGNIYKILSNNRVICIKQTTTKNYNVVSINKKKYEVKRLIAQAWLDNPENLNVVINIDGNPRNNNVSNLLWANQRDAILTCDKRIGSYHSIFKGVSYMYNKNKPWICQHHHNGNVYHTSFHKSELEAAKTYNDVVLSLNPRICVLNNVQKFDNK